MSKSTLLPAPMEVSRLPELTPPTFTRGLRREQAKREREGTRYTPERTDPRDADLVALLAAQGKITETRLPDSSERAALADLARDSMDRAQDQICPRPPKQPPLLSPEP